MILTSIPDVVGIWQKFHGDAAFAARWRRPGTCPLALGPQATDSTRDRLRLMTIQYNVVLRTTCAAFRACYYDGGTVNALRLERDDYSTYDGLHLSVLGEAKVAAATWAAGGFARVRGSAGR